MNLVKELKENGGFTLIGGEQPLSGFCVGVKGYELVLSGLEAVGTRTLEVYAAGLPAGVGFGGWLDSETGLVYLDAVEVFADEAEAVQAGKERGELAIFNLSTLEEIRL